MFALYNKMIKNARYITKFCRFLQYFIVYLVYIDKVGQQNFTLFSHIIQKNKNNPKYCQLFQRFVRERR